MRANAAKGRPHGRFGFGYRRIYTVDGHGRKGLEMAVQSECCLVLLDLVLPGMDGLEILREIRKSRPALPVIILTARGDPDGARREMQRFEELKARSPGAALELAGPPQAVPR